MISDQGSTVPGLSVERELQMIADRLTVRFKMRGKRVRIAVLVHDDQLERPRPVLGVIGEDAHETAISLVRRFGEE